MFTRRSFFGYLAVVVGGVAIPPTFAAGGGFGLNPAFPTGSWREVNDKVRADLAMIAARLGIVGIPMLTTNDRAYRAMLTNPKLHRLAIGHNKFWDDGFVIGGGPADNGAGPAIAVKGEQVQYAEYYIECGGVRVNWYHPNAVALLGLS